MNTNGTLSSESSYIIPSDGRKRKAIIKDTLTGQQNTFYVTKNKAGVTTFYVKNGKEFFRVPRGTTNFSKFTSRGHNPRMTPRDRHLDFDYETTHFLTTLCPDFGYIKRMIDSDIGLLPTEVNTVRTVYMKGKKSGSGGEHGEVLKRRVEKKSTVDMYNVDIDPINKYKIIFGKMQSKKTFSIISISLYYLFRYRMSTFIIVRNSVDDCTQLTSRLSDVIDTYVKRMTDNKKYQEQFKKLFAVLDVDRGKTVQEDQLNKAMDGRQPQIFVSLRNKSDIDPVNKIVEKMTTKRYAVIIDESDDVDSGSKAISQFSLDVLKENSSLVWGVTATPLTTLVKEDVERGNVVVLRKPENYKDLPTFTFKDLKHEAIYSTKISDNLFDTDPNLKGYITDFSKTKPWRSSFYNGSKHPRYSLIRAGNTIDPQIHAAEYVMNKYGSRIVTITYNGSTKGITMRGKNLPNKSITIPGTKINSVVYEYEPYTHYLSGMHIGKVIEYLMKNGGVDKFPRIMVFAGKLADRGISFGTADFGDCVKAERIPWHLTELYLIASKTTTQGNLLQVAGRLCGVFRDDVPLTLYSNVGKEIIKAYWAQDELIERARKTVANREIKMAMKELLPDVSISEDKCSKRRFTSFHTLLRVKKVKNDSEEGGWDWKAEGKTYKGETAMFGKGSRTSVKQIAIDEEKVREIRKEVEKKREEEARKRREMGGGKGKYTVIDETVFGKTTKVRALLEDAIKVIIDNGWVNNDVKKADVNKELLKMKRWVTGESYVDQVNNINGSWNRLQDHSKLSKTTNKGHKESLLYWKNGEHMMIRLNSGR